MIRLTVSAVALSLGLAGSAVADEEDVARGLALAERWCTECHVIGTDVAGGDAGPSFVSVANRWFQTERSIESWLAAPHPPMPAFNFGALETDALAQYIMTLVKE